MLNAICSENFNFYLQTKLSQDYSYKIVLKKDKCDDFITSFISKKGKVESLGKKILVFWVNCSHIARTGLLIPNNKTD